MRKVIYGGANSLDNYLAGPGETIDWLRWSDDAAKISAENFKGVDAMLMGRKTFDFAQRMGGGPVPAGVKTYVLSRTLDQDEFRARTSPGRSAPSSVLERPPGRSAPELVRGDAAEFVRRLKSEPGGNIIVMGGGEIGSALIEAGLVDEIGFSIHPVLVGGGSPAFPPFSHGIDLELIEARPIARECVLVRYRVRKEA